MTAHPKTTFRNHHDWTLKLTPDARDRERGIAVDNCRRIWVVATGTKPYEKNSG